MSACGKSFFVPEMGEAIECDLPAGHAGVHSYRNAYFHVIREPRPATPARPMAVVFDGDGTIIDSMPMLEELAVELMFDSLGFSQMAARQYYRNTIGRSFYDQLAAIAVPLNRRKACAEAFYRSKLAPWRRCKPFARAREIVQGLQGRANVFMASSTEVQLVAQWVHENNLPMMLFPGPTKLASLQGIAAAHRRALFIGDAPYDAELAREVGMDFIGLTHTVGVRANWPAGCRLVASLADAEGAIAEWAGVAQCA